MSNKLFGYDNQLWRVEHEFGYTGTDQPFTLDPGTYLFICEGAHGGTGARPIKEYGGMTFGEITLNETTTFHAVVGSDGGDYNSDYALCTGGFNGGAHGGMSYSSSYLHGPGGGGATDIRLLPYDPKEYPTYDDEGNVTFPEPEKIVVTDGEHTSMFGDVNFFGEEQEAKMLSWGSHIKKLEDGRIYGEDGCQYEFYDGSGTSSNDASKAIPIAGELGKQYVMTAEEYMECRSRNSYSVRITFSWLYSDGTRSSAMVPNSPNDGSADNVLQHLYPTQYSTPSDPSKQVIGIQASFNYWGWAWWRDIKVREYYPVFEYIPLEYIYAWGGTNSGYFNTNYIPKANTKIEMDCVCYENTINNYQTLFGTRNNNWQYNAYVFFMRFSSDNVPVYGRSGAETQGTDFVYNEKIKLICYRDKAEWFLNGVSKGNIITTGTIDDCTNPLLINMTNRYSGSNGVTIGDEWAKFKLYSFKISEVGLSIDNPSYQLISYINANGIHYEPKQRAYMIDDTAYTSIHGFKFTGSQVFDTGEIHQAHDRLEIDFQMFTASNGVLFDSRINNIHTNTMGVALSTDGCFLFNRSSNILFVQRSTWNYSSHYDMSYTLSLQDKTMTLYDLATNTLLETCNPPDDNDWVLDDGIYTMAIGNVHNKDHMHHSGIFGQFIFYGFRWYRDDKLIHHFVPANRNSDGKLGMYDLVDRKFITENYGTITEQVSIPSIVNEYPVQEIATGKYGIYNKETKVFTEITNVDAHGEGMINNELIVRNYIPARRDSDNAVGLFDLVNNTFITQSGSGYWEAGPPKTKHPSLNSRIMVAAGAGGGINQSESGGDNDSFSYGGGPYGSTVPSYSIGPDPYADNWPSQTTGYAFGYGMFPAKQTGNYGYSCEGCGGGGGGWYSGYASNPSAHTATRLTKQGGGGSSYVLTESSYKPDGYNPGSKYYFTKALLHGSIAMGDLFSTNPNDWNNGRVYICKLENNIRRDDIIIYPCTGKSVNHDLPPGRYKLKCWGGDGGSRWRTSHCVKGGYSEGIIDTSESHQIYVYTGGSGGPRANVGYSDKSMNMIGTANLPSLKFNGGQNIQNLTKILSSSGGGTDIRFDEDDFYHRVIVAGGAGSEGMSGNYGGTGGGTSGGSANGSYGTNNGPGTQTSGYAFGVGGPGYYQYSGYGGCGGGGWYGGYGTTPNGGTDNDRSGAGGSGFVLTETSVVNVPIGYGCDDEEFYLTDAQTLQGENNLPMFHTKTQIECLGVSARCICRDSEGYKYYDKESKTWALLPTQTITPDVFMQYGSSIKTDNGLLDEYYIYTYDETEITDLIGLKIIPNAYSIDYVLDSEISITEATVDAQYNRGSFQVAYSIKREKQEDGSYQSIFRLHIIKMKDNDDVLKVYYAQLFTANKKQPHAYLKLDKNGNRIFKHIYFDEDTGDMMEEERTMERKDPEEFRNEIGEIETAQYLLRVGAANKIPVSYNSILDNDITDVYNTAITEHDRTIFYAIGCKASGAFYLVINAMNFMTGTISNVCRIPWGTVYSINNNMFIYGFLVDDKYFYLCMEATSNASTAYKQSLVRINRNDFSVLRTSQSGYNITAYGKMDWYDDNTIICHGTGGRSMYYDTIKDTWRVVDVDGCTTSATDWCVGNKYRLASYNRSVDVIDMETETVVKTLAVTNDYGCRICHDGDHKFYLAQQNYLYAFDENTCDWIKIGVEDDIPKIISVMQTPLHARYCNGAVIIPQYSNQRLVVYDTAENTIQTIYLPWNVAGDYTNNRMFVPYAFNGCFFYLVRSGLLINYTGYAKYKFGAKFNRHTIFYNESIENLEYDRNFIDADAVCCKTKNDGLIGYALGKYNNNHIARTAVIKKSDYKYLKGSVSMTTPIQLQGSD